MVGLLHNVTKNSKFFVIWRHTSSAFFFLSKLINIFAQLYVLSTVANKMKERLTSALFLIVFDSPPCKLAPSEGGWSMPPTILLIPSASVYIEGKLDIGTDADTAGYFTLHLPDGKYTICCDFLGYISEKKNINLKGSTTVNFKMQVNPQQLNAVVVSASGIKAATEIPQMSVSQLDVRDLMKMPACLESRM